MRMARTRGPRRLAATMAGPLYLLCIRDRLRLGPTSTRTTSAKDRRAPLETAPGSPQTKLSPIIVDPPSGRCNPIRPTCSLTNS